MSLLLTILFDGIIYASWLFIVALGLTLVFGVLKILNIAHGSFYAVGAYAGASLVTWLLSIQVSPALGALGLVAAAVGVAAIVAPLTERGLLRMFYGRDEVLLVLVTYALFLMLEDVMKLIWGVNPYYVADTYQAFGNVQLGALSYVGYDVMLIGVAVVCGALTWWVLNHTRQGKIVTSVIHSAEVASSMGVNVSRIYTGAFMVGVFLAALGGALTAPMLSVQPGLSVGVIITSFAVVIIGGLGSIEGAAIGAIVVGLARAASVHLWPPAELFSIYLVMAAILVFKPQGLSGQKDLSVHVHGLVPPSGARTGRPSGRRGGAGLFHRPAGVGAAGSQMAGLPGHTGLRQRPGFARYFDHDAQRRRALWPRPGVCSRRLCGGPGL
jgi:branched-chain amino acid transport system permease protein